MLKQQQPARPCILVYTVLHLLMVLYFYTLIDASIFYSPLHMKHLKHLNLCLCEIDLFVNTYFFNSFKCHHSILYVVFCTSLFYKTLMSVKSCSVYSTTATVSISFFFEVMHCYLCVCGSLVEPPHFINHLKSRLWSQLLKKSARL